MINTMYQEQKRAFFELKGGKDHWLNIRGLLYAEDGSTLNPDQMGNFEEPPANMHERLKRVIAYHEEKLRLVRRKFDELKANLEGACHVGMKHNVPPPSDSSLEELQAIKSEIQQWSAALNRHKEASEQTAEAQAAADRREKTARNQEALAAYLERVRAIKA